jgi:hypothetical protein
VLQTDKLVFGSYWPLTATGEAAWTLVNRGTDDVTGAQIELNTTGVPLFFYDCYAGEKITPTKNAMASTTNLDAPDAAIEGAGVAQTVTLSFTVEKKGFGCVFATPNATLDAKAAIFIQTMQRLTRGGASRLDSFGKVLLELVGAGTAAALLLLLLLLLCCYCCCVAATAAALLLLLLRCRYCCCVATTAAALLLLLLRCYYCYSIILSSSLSCPEGLIHARLLPHLCHTDLVAVTTNHGPHTAHTCTRHSPCGYGGGERHRSVQIRRQRTGDRARKIP